MEDELGLLERTFLTSRSPEQYERLTLHVREVQGVVGSDTSIRPPAIIGQKLPLLSLSKTKLCLLLAADPW